MQLVELLAAQQLYRVQSDAQVLVDPLRRAKDLMAASSPASPSFVVDFAPAVGLGEGTPDPDAIGMLRAVPEPSTWALFGAGVAGLAWWRRFTNHR